MWTNGTDASLNESWQGTTARRRRRQMREATLSHKRHAACGFHKRDFSTPIALMEPTGSVALMLQCCLSHLSSSVLLLNGGAS